MFGREVGGRISWIEVVTVDFEEERSGIAWLEGIAEMAAADPIVPFPGFKERPVLCMYWALSCVVIYQVLFPSDYSSWFELFFA